MSDIAIGEMNAYLATPPTGGGPWPGVVVLHESFGLNDDIRAHAGRLASAGYLALAPDLYSRGGRARCLVATFRAHASGKGQAFDDIEAARGHLARHALCTGKVGVIGFCLGGGFALLSGTRGFDAAAPNYGHPPKDLGAALRGACPMVASYGGRDRSLRGVAAKVEAALAENLVPHDVKEYPDAGHSFLSHMPAGLAPVLRVANIGYHGPSAEDAWTRILGFFDEHLR